MSVMKSSVLLALVGYHAAGESMLKNRPVRKVIDLLKNMEKELDAEREEDETAYKKMTCWCKENGTEKEQAIGDAEKKLKALQAALEKGVAKSAQLNQEVKNAEKELNESETSLKEATTLREKQSATFNETVKDLVQAIAGLKSAKTVLSKHTSASFLQTDDLVEAAMEAESAVANRVAGSSVDQLVQKILNTAQKRNTFFSFIQAKAVVSGDGGQSGQIFGIISQMLDDFKNDLEEKKTEEDSNMKNFEDLKAEKRIEIEELRKMIDEKSDIAASTDEKLAADQEDKKDTTATLEADRKFYEELKVQCKQASEDYDQRNTDRAEEIDAVNTALEFLNSDEAHDLFSATLSKPGEQGKPPAAFLQLGKSTSGVLRRKAAVQLLKYNPRVSMLVTSVQNDAFAAVFKNIDQMVQDVSEQKKMESQIRDQCVEDFHRNEKETSDNDRKIKENEAERDELTERVKLLTTAVENCGKKIEEDRASLKAAGEDRAAENALFQKEVSNQSATVQLLKKTVNVLKSVFEKKGFFFVQEGGMQAPPTKFAARKGRGERGGGVIGMIEQIVADTEHLMADTKRAEADSQKSYEETVKSTNLMLKTLEEEQMNKSETKATKQGDLVEAKSELKDAVTQGKALSEEHKILKTKCDFLMKNFEITQQAMDDEVDALKQAKAILKGSVAGGDAAASLPEEAPAAVEVEDVQVGEAPGVEEAPVMEEAPAAPAGPPFSRQRRL